jgi:hypothetical protein
VRTFMGGEPIDVHVGDHVVREIERDVGEEPFRCAWPVATTCSG